MNSKNYPKSFSAPLGRRTSWGELQPFFWENVTGPQQSVPWTITFQTIRWARGPGRSLTRKRSVPKLREGPRGSGPGGPSRGKSRVAGTAAPPPLCRGLGGCAQSVPARPGTPPAGPARPYLALLGAQPVHRVVHRQGRAAPPRHRQRPPAPRPGPAAPQQRHRPRHGRSRRSPRRRRPAPSARPAPRPPPGLSHRPCSNFNELNPRNRAADRGQTRLRPLSVPTPPRSSDQLGAWITKRRNWV